MYYTPTPTTPMKVTHLRSQGQTKKVVLLSEALEDGLMFHHCHVRKKDNNHNKMMDPQPRIHHHCCHPVQQPKQKPPPQYIKSSVVHHHARKMPMDQAKKMAMDQVSCYTWILEALSVAVLDNPSNNNDDDTHDYNSENDNNNNNCHCHNVLESMNCKIMEVRCSYQ